VPATSMGLIVTTEPSPSGFQTSFLNSLSTTRQVSGTSEETVDAKSVAVSLPLAPVIVASITPPAELPTAPLQQQPAPQHPHQQQQQQTLPMTMGGASSTQMRALQNLPPNTRLVRGPNGQMTLQKVQTIELTADLQQVCTSSKIFV
jgi:hypothetical protein